MILGAFGARGFLVAAPDARMLIMGLLFGYGAGVAAGLSLRPRISVPSILVAIVPTIVAAWSTMNVTAAAAGLLLAVFLAGGIESMLRRYRAAIAKIGMRQTFSTLARQDHLTGLPNRLALRERFEQCVAPNNSNGGFRLAVHCLDLNRFKPVNDRYGHPVGNALLRAVSERLGQSLRGADFAARIGGDEFVVVQGHMGHEGEAELLAHRIARLIAEPFSIEGHIIRIGTSVGYAVAERRDSDLGRLSPVLTRRSARSRSEAAALRHTRGRAPRRCHFWRPSPLADEGPRKAECPPRRPRARQIASSLAESREASGLCAARPLGYNGPRQRGWR